MHTKEKMQEKESGFMLNDEICKLREELNRSIVDGQDYEITYKLSTELDRLIAEYYSIELQPRGSKRVKEDIKRKIKEKNACK